MPKKHNKSTSLRLLGGWQLDVGEQPASELNYEKGRALLAYLAIEKRQHARATLGEMLWPGSTASRANLRQVLSNLRAVLNDSDNVAVPYLLVERDTLRINPNGLLRLDVADFIGASPNKPGHAEMERRAGLYRGEFMAGFSLPDCPDFEDWLQIQRESLHLHAVSMLEQLANGFEQDSDYGKAIQFATRQAALDPWNEDAHRRVMSYYAANGQTSAAIAQYETCCRLLKGELGVLPDEATRHLAERIRAGEFQRRPTAPVEVPPLQTLRQFRAERRQVSVLYCELTLAAVDDPDEEIALLRKPQARCVEIIQHFSGHVVQSHGGSLLAYFGYPDADENEARHAVEAALAATREAAGDIEIRAGVHTGLIITGSDSTRPDTAGKASRLAIQCCQCAAPDAVAISADTRCIVAGYFDCISQSVQSLPRSTPPLEFFNVTGESGARTRLDAAAQLTRLVGREAEIARLLDLWEEATQGKRQMLLIQGEAGIGKSRLLLTLKERLADTPHILRELRCFQEHSQSPFHPLIVMLGAVFGFAHDDTPEAKLTRLERYLNAHYPASARDYVPLLARMFSLPLGAHYPAPGLSPQKLKERIATTLLDMLQALAAKRPTLFIVEDLHWIDPSTLELLTQLVDHLSGGAILLLLTARPEFVPLWEKTTGLSLTLNPLVDSDVTKMIAFLGEHIPPETIERIVQRADGVPLFVEEMVKLANQDSQAGIPTTLLDLLAARMNNLGEAKYTAQLAATLGREFDLNWLRKISPRDAAALAHDLGALQDAGLIFAVSETVCQFNHALIQEAAYQALPRVDRETAHRRVAHVLQSEFPDVVATRPELLAQHLFAGGDTLPAIACWIKAGQRAARNSANLAAVGQFNAGLKLLLTLPENQERDRTEFKMLVSLCPVLYAAKGYGSEEAARASARLADLNGRVGDSPELFMAKWALMVSTVASVGSRGIPDAAKQLLNMARDDTLKMIAAHSLAAIASFWLGEFESTRAHDEQALALYRPDQRQMLLEQFGSDLSIHCASYLSCALYFLGFADQAQCLSRQMLLQAREMDHPHNLAQALNFASLLQRWLNRPDAALALSAEAIAIGRQHDLSLWLACGLMIHGWALVRLGQSERGLAELQSCVAGMRVGMGGISVVVASSAIEAQVYLNRHDEALRLIAEAQADEANTGDGHFSAELHRLKGECLRALSPLSTAEAEACFAQALAISRKQQAKSMELRAATSMARLWRQQDKHEDARCILEGIYSWFTEGFDTHDLQEATADVQRRF
jgi:predicted ATPase/DNA-binding SARP family transcriptional activator